jgi:hypothetical protein
MDTSEIKLERPLFYKCSYGLRFEIGPLDKEIWNEDSKTLNDEYFNLALERAIGIFNASFSPSDEVAIVYQIGSDGRKKIKKRSFIFKQVKTLDEATIEYTDHRDIYPENLDYKRECWKRVTISGITTEDINTEQLLKAAINTDFLTRFPQMNGECYLINKTKQIILNLYDDRGMDVVSTTKEALESLYNTHNDRILNYDRERIDKVFS